MPNGVHNAGCVSLNLDKSSYDENTCFILSLENSQWSIFIISLTNFYLKRSNILEKIFIDRKWKKTIVFVQLYNWTSRIISLIIPIQERYENKRIVREKFHFEWRGGFVGKSVKAYLTTDQSQLSETSHKICILPVHISSPPPGNILPIFHKLFFSSRGMALVLLTIRTAIVSWRHLFLSSSSRAPPSRVCGREVESWGGSDLSGESKREPEREREREREWVPGVAEDNTIPADSVYGWSFDPGSLSLSLFTPHLRVPYIPLLFLYRYVHTYKCNV